MKIILHAGTPKTGTTSLQLFLHSQREYLLDQGILYPSEGVSPPPEPKHQWMISSLLENDISNFFTRINSALKEARSDTHTIILSSEGLFHRWWDFSPQALDALSTLSSRFALEFWVFFREPVDFIRSFYIQMLKNPRGLGPCYGEDMSLNDMLDVPRFSVHLNYIRYIREVEAIIGTGKVRPFRYDGNTVADVLSALSISNPGLDETWENRSVGEFGVSLLRQINRLNLGFDPKRRAVKLVEELSKITDADAGQMTIEADEIRRIHEFSAESLECFSSVYGIKFDQT